MNLKILSGYSYYSLKVLIGAVILVAVAISTTSQVIRKKLSPFDANGPED